MQERKSRNSINVGDRIKSNTCGLFTVLERNGDYSVVKFDTGYTCTCSNTELSRGRAKDPLYPQVLGVGYFGIGSHISTSDNNTLPEYNAWQNMLQRCYYEKYIRRVDGGKAYDTVTVDPVWHNFQNFAEWYVPRRKLFDDNNIKRPALDKDILAIPDQPKVYSPDTCCLVPDEINGAIVGTDKEDSGIIKAKNGYYVIHKRKRVTNYFDTVEEAREVKKVIKQEHFISLANKYQHVIEPRVYDRLCNWFNT
jgi:hypothetical protein